MDNLELIIASVAIMFVGGMVKGVIGLGLPLVTVSLLSIIMPVQEVVGLLSLPIVFSNAWQAHQTGGMGGPIKRFWPLIIAALLGVLIGVHMLVSVEPRYLYGIIGALIIVSCVTMLTKWVPHIEARHEKPIGVAVGAIGGISGGISTIWSPPITIYLLMLNVKKEEFIRTAGTLFFVGQVPTVMIYAYNGVLNTDNVWWSAALVPVAFASMRLGQMIRNRVSQEMFRTMLLIFLIILGCILLGRVF